MDDEYLTELEDENDPVENLIEQYFSSQMAAQMQDAQACEQAHLKAELFYNNLEDKEDEEEKKNLKFVVDIISATMHFVKSINNTSEERYAKSLEELDTAIQICDEALVTFKNFSDEDLEDFDIDYEDYGLVSSSLKFQFAFMKHLCVVNRGFTQKSIERIEGKYVDEVEVNHLTAKELKNFKISDNYEHNDNKILQKIVTGSVMMINRIADSCEKKAERIIEQRKTIEFIKPYDKKVFIIHGHNEGLLRELNDILVNAFKIEPVILKNKADKGKTVIEKLEDYGRLCAFAFAIVTPDDIVENKEKKAFQARPNVLYELGWFCGRYGRSKVRILRQHNTTLPSDLDGVVTIDFHDKIEEVYRKLESEMQETGIL